MPCVFCLYLRYFKNGLLLLVDYYVNNKWILLRVGGWGELNATFLKDFFNFAKHTKCITMSKSCHAI